MDEAVIELLEKLKLDKIRIIRLSEIETPELESVKLDRTVAEYCWTLTPFTFDAVFSRDPNVLRVTYVDADVMLFDDPQPVFDELETSEKQILITEHDYLPHWDQTKSSGRFCVQFIPATQMGSYQVRRWWQERCLEWCFARSEEGKFGDQGYLDQWPVLFPELVHVSAHNNWFQAPWNSRKFNPLDAITYHFHGTKLRGTRITTRGPYPLHQAARGIFYRKLRKELVRLRRELGFSAKIERANPIASLRRRFAEKRLFFARLVAVWIAQKLG